MKTCPKCKGLGWYYQETKWDWFTKVSKIICSDCKGTGEIELGQWSQIGLRIFRKGWVATLRGPQWGSRVRAKERLAIVESLTNKIKFRRANGSVSCNHGLPRDGEILH